MSPLLFTDYKAYLKDLFDRSETRGLKAQLSQSAGCQPSFLSQVMSGSVHLTLDHAMGMAKFFKFSGLETDYFYLLVAHARAATPALRKHYEEKMRELRRKNESLTDRLQDAKREEDPHPEYHSSWRYRALHMACTIPRLQSVAALARHFQLEPTAIERDLRKLKAWGYVTDKGGAWKATQKTLHLPKDHFMNSVSHRNWRLRNLEVLEKSPDSALSYTALYSMSREDFEKLKDVAIRFIEETRQIVVPSPEEELVSFTLDCLLL